MFCFERFVEEDDDATDNRRPHDGLQSYLLALKAATDDPLVREKLDMIFSGRSVNH